jgi:heterodisulfide reductase subunit D
MGIKDIRETTESCKHCFMCRHACPTFLTTKLDSHTPRGYALLLSEIDHGLQSWTPTIIERFYQCSLCGLCREDCAYHWAEDEVVRNAREEIVAGNLAPERVRQAASSFMTDHPGAWPAISAAFDKKDAEVLYVAGCSTRQNHPEIIRALDRIMRTAGVDWTVMREEQCCGTPLFELGFTREAESASRALMENIGQLRPKLLLTGCAHCFRALSEHNAEGLPVMHLSQYLDRRFPKGILKRKQLSRVSYHDPCQLGRKMKEFDAPRRLIQAVTGSAPLELFHQREKAECCGSGSCMYLTDPQLVKRIAGRRLQGLRETDSHVLITACQNCKTAFQSALPLEGFEVQVLDLAELVAMALEG